jgi:NAD(P)-dependent dehydrogenase (short-subunit alcohol dehydrogenase family)
LEVDVEVRDSVCVVTGGAAGIGRALADRFVREGASHVVIADIAEPALRATAEAIGATAIVTDVGDEASIRSLIETVEADHGPIDLFVANAGIGGPPGGVEVPDEEWQRIWEINVMHHVWAARHLVPRWIDRGGGYLLTTASAAGLLSNLGIAPYTVTKHAAVGLAEWLSITHADQGIRVSVLCPQAVRTAMTEVDDPAVANVIAHGMIEPEDVADAVIAGLATESFWILPHPEVAGFVAHKGTDIESWLDAMRHLQRRFFGSAG